MGDVMTSLYEHWKPGVGDRVRIVERNETGAATETGRTGTVVAIHGHEPEALCEVEYDGPPGTTRATERQRHAAAELQPIGEATVRNDGGGRARPDLSPEIDTAWRPTVGDRVMVAPEGRGATITAVEERPDGTVCEVEYNHRPGEAAEPQRGNHALHTLTPTREPSAEALEQGGRA